MGLKTILEKNRDNLKLLFMDAVIIIAVWGQYLQDSFCRDTLLYAVRPDVDISTWFRYGRFLACGLNTLLYKVGFTVTGNYKICLGFFLLALIFSLFIVQCTFLPLAGEYLKTAGHRVAYVVVTALIFVNVLFSEFFMFTECYQIFPYAFFAASAGVYFLTRKKWIPGLILMACACFFYQVALSYAAMIYATYLVIEAKGKLSRSLVIREIIGAFAIMVWALVDYIGIEFFTKIGYIQNSAKSVGSASLAERLYSLIDPTKEFLLNARRLMPSVGLPLLITVLCVAVLLVHMWKTERSGVITIILLCILMYTFTAALIMVEGASTEAAPRMLASFFCMQSMLLLTALLLCADKIKTVITAAAGLYLASQVMFCGIIASNHYMDNALDLANAQAIQEKINEYEEATGNTIVNISVHPDTDSPDSYEQVKYKIGEINKRSYGMVTTTLMCYYSLRFGDGRNYESRVMDEAFYEEHFGGKNWDSLDLEEQLILDGDTAYICTY